ncbi:MAG: hypothetical protein QJR06_05345 [Alicyclobacillaceae bacterium]|nr:hypothetical protein [Alicyclobacillaceae bacterium]
MIAEFDVAVRSRPAVLLDFDPAFDRQPDLRRAADYTFSVPRPPRWLCPEKERAAIAGRFLRLPRPRLTFIGSGDYHYLTALFLEQIGHPVTLLLIDHHDDAAGEPRGVLSCGNWVRYAARQPWVRAVVSFDGRRARWTPAQPAGARFRWLPVPLRGDPGNRPEQLLPYIPTQSLYISIDKDVLRPEEAGTNWDQGSMAVQELLNLLGALAARRSIFAMDVCGETSPRLPGLPTPEEQRNISANERVNLNLLRFWRRVSRTSPLPRSA